MNALAPIDYIVHLLQQIYKVTSKIGFWLLDLSSIKIFHKKNNSDVNEELKRASIFLRKMFLNVDKIWCLPECSLKYRDPNDPAVHRYAQEATMLWKE